MRFLCVPAAEAKAVLQSTVKLDSIQSPEFYDCIFVPGGHGPMYDLAASELLGDILTKAAAAGRTGALFVSVLDSTC